MLSNKEKKEMLNNAKSPSRKENFRLSREKREIITFDDYLFFLNNIQKIVPFKLSRRITFTRLNKL